MPISQFPDPRRTTEDGVLAIGGDLEPESLLLAYGQGIFPWPVFDDGIEILAWFCPEKRAILEFADLHVPASLAKFARRQPYRLTVNQDFRAVIEACSEAPRPGQDGTWITPDMIDAYCELHRLGHALSVEVWADEPGPDAPPREAPPSNDTGSDAVGITKLSDTSRAFLVGGIYGVLVDGLFAGESMFHRRTNASKLALLHLIGELKGRGITWMDIQVMTPHMKALGARELSRDEFLRKLEQSRAPALRT
jgi:leucyl/phenylalanyl-tRNA--protein transferase